MTHGWLLIWINDRSDQSRFRFELGRCRLENVGGATYHNSPREKEIMQGKIGLEEHFAIEETLIHTNQLEGNSDLLPEIQRRLLEFGDLRLAEMDRHGIEMSILSLNALGVEAILDPTEAVEISRKANDALAEEIARRPDRYAGFAALPMQDPDNAIEELTRCVNELGFKGALVNGHSCLPAWRLDTAS